MNNKISLPDPSALDSLQFARLDVPSFKHNGKLVQMHQQEGEEEEPESEENKVESMAANCMKRLFMWICASKSERTHSVRSYIISMELIGYPSSYRSIARLVGCNPNYVSIEALGFRNTFPMFRAQQFKGKKQRKTIRRV